VCSANFTRAATLLLTQISQPYGKKKKKKKKKRERERERERKRESEQNFCFSFLLFFFFFVRSESFVLTGLPSAQLLQIHAPPISHDGETNKFV
jgi:predicted ATP-dependent protease